MSQLNFRIIVLPSSVEDIHRVDTIWPFKVLLRQSCGITIRSSQQIQLKNTRTQSQPEILELIYDIEAISTQYFPSKVDAFVDLAVKWCNATATLQKNRPMLQLCHNESFLRKRVSCHENLPLKSFRLGVLPRFGNFLEYHRMEVQNPTVSFFHDQKEIDITLSKVFNAFDNTDEVLSSTISYSHIRNIIVQMSATEFTMYLDLLHVPLFYMKTIEWGSFNLRTNFFRDLLPNVRKDVLGKSNIICLQFQPTLLSFQILSGIRNRCDKIPVNFVAVNLKSKAVPTIPRIRFGHFGCWYMWTAIVERSFTILEQSCGFEARLAQYCVENAPLLEKVLTRIVFMIDSGRLINYWNAIEELYRFYQKSTLVHDLYVPSKCRLIRRATLTPHRLLLWPPDLMCENRMLRNFDSDFFLRVTFRDDDLVMLNYRKYSDAVLAQVISKPMKSGVAIGDRLYKILAWSNSQLREHGVSMYAMDTMGRDASHIRRWTEIDPNTTMNIPKCLSRMGQCFSQTEDTLHVPLDNLHVRVEPDITRGRNSKTLEPYCFSDGVGKMSVELATRVKATLRHSKHCSAFQIRYGGCKGMLTVDPTLRGIDIIFRDSMRKFNCRGLAHTKLEIANKTAPILLRLNRPLITLLHDLKVPPAVFLRLQENMIQNITDILLDEEKATEYLHSRTPLSVFKFKDLSKSGISLTIEPFFKNLLLALHRYVIDIIKTKANIDIDPAFGRNMYGVLDETGQLKYGEVFVQYTRDAFYGVSNPEDAIILKGSVMVTKFPCVHPGDVRKFRAVDIPGLRHIVDCIVFPQNGHRPHPDEMAGSDLDGDQYAVIWMPELIFSQPNVEPPDYPKPKSDQYQNVRDFLIHSETDAVIEFVKDYIIKDQIGSIASAHLSISDQSNIFSDCCLSIAAKHAIAVDFPKTGCTAYLNRFERPMKNPDFMETAWKRRYRSKKSLGKMYRVSKDFESETQVTLLHYQDVRMDPALEVPGWQRYEHSALTCRDEYNTVLSTLLHTYGIRHESEAFGGSFIKLHARFRERRDRAEIVQLVHTWLKSLVEQTRKKFIQEFGTGDLNEIIDDVERKASAWYMVTYSERNPEFLSFPWIVSDFLSNIRIRRPNPHQGLGIPLVAKLEQLIVESVGTGMLPSLNRDALFLMRPLSYLRQRDLVEKALRVLTLWAADEKITTFTNNPRYLFYKTFAKLFLYVAQDEISKHHPITSAGLCLAFFKYCMSLRFRTKKETEKILPFFVYHDRLLSKSAIMAFHSIAVSGVLPALCNKEFLEAQEQCVDMKPWYIESAIFDSVTPIEVSKLRNAGSRLETYSETEQVILRERSQKKTVIVTAWGRVAAIRRLRHLLGKQSSVLKEFFQTGHLIEQQQVE